MFTIKGGSEYPGVTIIRVYCSIIYKDIHVKGDYRGEYKVITEQ